MSNKMKILVVDDEPDLREILADEFRFVDAEVFEASNGVEALAIYNREKPGAVVSDIRMPGGDGVTLAKAVKMQDPVGSRVFLITGFADLTAEQAYDFGVEGFFTKPFHLEEIREAVIGSLQPSQDRWGKTVVAEEIIPVVLNSEDYKKDFTEGLYKVGRGGFFLPQSGMVAKTALRSGQKVELRSGREKLGIGAVRWVRGEGNDKKLGCGIEFLSLEPEFLKFVVALMATQAPSAAFIPA
jgi:CheY-like chemotaxis protein